MIFIKSILAGIAALLISSILFVAIAVLMFLAQTRHAGTAGIGAISVGIGEGTLWILSLLIFAAGFWWEFRRASNWPTTRQRVFEDARKTRRDGGALLHVLQFRARASDAPGDTCDGGWRRQSRVEHRRDRRAARLAQD